MKNQEQNITDELAALEVSLEHKPSMPLGVPTGYFKDFKKDTLELISAIDYVENLPKTMPQELPVNYFDKFKEEMLDEVSVLEFEKSLSKDMPQEVPMGYFEQSKAEMLASITEESDKSEESGLRVSRRNRRNNWALAASMALIVSLGLFFVQSENSTINLENELSSVSSEMIEDYIGEHEYDFEAYDILENPELISKDMKSIEEEILIETENLSNEELFEYVL